MSITTHCIDIEWVMMERIISSSLLSYPCTSARIESNIIEQTREFNIKNKITSIYDLR